MNATIAMRTLLASLLTLSAALPSRAQTWEMLPLFGPFRAQTNARAVDFLRGEGAQAADPAADTLVWIGSYGAFLYNPSGASGAAGPNGEWGVWHLLCSNGQCTGPAAGLVTTAGTFLIGGNGPTGFSRGTNRGRRWALNFESYAGNVLFETEQAAPVGALIGGVSDNGVTVRSLQDGAPGTWAIAGSGFGFPQSFGEVPPSPALPNGRILMGVWNGAVYSDDGGLSYRPSNAYGQARYIVYAFTFLPQAGHPYGGVTYAGMHNVALGPGPSAEVHRSDDGGATWSLAHRFTAAELELPVFTGERDVDLLDVTALLATPDGALWAGVGFSGGASNPARGGIARSTDGGATWARADAGFRDATGRGYQLNQLKLSRTGVLYAATERGIWRTTAAVVASEAAPVEAAGVDVSVRPNPASGRVEVVLSLTEAGPVRVAVVDALGREVAVVLDGAAGSGETVAPVETGAWPAGVYVVRAVVAGRLATARLVVAR